MGPVSLDMSTSFEEDFHSSLYFEFLVVFIFCGTVYKTAQTGL